MLSKVDSLDHTILVLPFTPSLLLDPSPCIPPILDLLPRSSKKSFTVLFSTPRGTLNNVQVPIPIIGSSQKQLYTVLKRSPRANFAILQSFLGAIYTVLWMAQWKCGRILLDVEVHFEEDTGGYERKLLRGRDEQEEYQVIKIDGVQETEFVETLDKIIPAPFTQISVSYPSLSMTQASGQYTPPSLSSAFPVVALGGTFDRLHAAHKLLLHLGLFLSQRKLIVGVMADNLLGSKAHSDLVQPLSERLKSVNAFLRRLGNEGVELDVLEIHDSLGPTRSDPDIQALVVSRETLSGGAYVNKARRDAGLEELELLVVDVIAEREEVDLKKEVDETKLKKMKMGSTGVRNWIAEMGTSQQER